MFRPFSRLIPLISLSFVLGFGMAAPRAAEAPTVVVSIAPIHALAAQVMAGTGTPRLLLPAGTSPHTTALRPSDALALSRARLVIWVGPMLEMALAKPIAALARDATVLRLAGARGVRLLPTREGGAWEPDADEPAHEHTGKGDLDIDPHVWLDPDNAAAMVRAIAEALARIDPANAKLYAANAATATGRIVALDAVLAKRLAPVKRVPFVVFHDAYQYFERHYGLTAVGSVTIAPDRIPGAKRLLALRLKIQENSRRLRVRRAPVRAEPDPHGDRGNRGAHGRARSARRSAAAGTGTLWEAVGRTCGFARRLPRPPLAPECGTLARNGGRYWD